MVDDPIIGINLGSGKNWQLRDWGAADYLISGDKLDENTTFPYADNTLKYAYSSHFFEHIDDNTAKNLFSETYRVLEPGGVFRITVPSMTTLAKKFVANDKVFFENILGFRGRPEWKQNGVTPNVCSYFLHFISNYDELVDGKILYRGGPKINHDEVKSRLLADDYESFFR